MFLPYAIDLNYLRQIHDRHCLWLATETGVFTVNAEADVSTVLLEATVKAVERIEHRFPIPARSTDAITCSEVCDLAGG